MWQLRQAFHVLFYAGSPPVLTLACVGLKLGSFPKLTVSDLIAGTLGQESYRTLRAAVLENAVPSDLLRSLD